MRKMLLVALLAIAPIHHGPHRSVLAGTCRVERSQTPEGYEVIYYPHDVYGHVPVGFKVPCPKG